MARTKTKTAEQTTLLPAEKGGAAVPALQSAAATLVATGDALFAIIERASRDPTVDIDKMERLVRMKLDMDARDAKGAYLSALAEMQPKLPVISKRGVISKNEKDASGNKTGRQEAMTKYARWEDVVEGITPVLAAHGFSLSFRVAQPTPERVAISGVLGHRAGHTEETTLSLPIDNTGAKNNVQGWGSSVSYGKRYVAFALLNISARGEDDDGNAAGDKFKAWTDAAIQELNEAKPDKAWLEKYQADNAKSISRLRKAAPEEYARFQTALSNAAEAAGIPREEPKRGAAPDSKATPNRVTDVVDQNDQAALTGVSSQGDQAKGGQQEGSPPGGGAPSASGAAAQSAPKKMTFKRFATSSEFIAAFEYFVEKDDRCNPESAAAWLKFYGGDKGAIAVCRNSVNADTKAYIETLVKMAEGIVAKGGQPALV